MIVLLAGLATWLGVICYSIATEPPKGAPNLQALRADVQKALRDEDGDTLQNLFDEDTVSDGYAGSYVKKLGPKPVASLQAVVKRQYGASFVVVSGTAGQRPLCTAWQVKEKDGRQQLDGVAPAWNLCSG
ncbi:hypothetical protein [Streptomyces sp. STR69]|uniref:hypothetical protein n=1 Tax=Streptomyces sp. STR69 TaxID=1796942 RepID=UPI0021C73E31|nr:hypothetical protein [Streptomyces sp. STR69]